ncbi:MAG: hypothetical protein CL483_09975 [Acidobacteria bacterium]|nr:hypothetical protein [Acidobacteriota bacterium]
MLVPRWSILGGFVETVATMTGVTVAELEPLTMLCIQTKSTFCEVTVPRSPLARVLVRGGRFFTELAEARFGGSSFVGSCVKLTWSGVWPHLELHALDEWIVTSRVQSISILSITAAYGHV